jgi:hypothetical protein
VVSRVRETVGIPKRHACWVLEQPRSSQGYATQTKPQQR